MLTEELINIFTLRGQGFFRGNIAEVVEYDGYTVKVKWLQKRNGYYPATNFNQNSLTVIHKDIKKEDKSDFVKLINL